MKKAKVTKLSCKKWELYLFPLDLHYLHWQEFVWSLTQTPDKVSNACLD